MYTKYAKLRDKHKMTDYEVAKQTGLSRSTLYEWGAGTHKPSLESLKALAKFFGVTVDYFIS